ncbi:hypothetical protein D9M72_551710 [compost metagenome]
MLPGNGCDDKRRECGNDEEELQHDLLLPLRSGITDKLAVSGYRERHRNQREERQGDSGTSEFETCGGPKQKRQNDIWSGEEASTQGKGGNAQEDEAENGSLRPAFDR